MERLTIRNGDWTVSQTTNLNWENVLYRLAAYEDTGLEPEQVVDIKLSLMGKSIAEVSEFDGISIDRLRELAKAEQYGKDARRLYHLALDTWGADAQTLMVFEEMSELQKELCKHARGKDNLESIADEIADVQIMLEQMMVLHDCDQVVMEHKAAKLKRLADRIESAASLAGKGGDV